MEMRRSKLAILKARASLVVRRSELAVCCWISWVWVLVSRAVVVANWTARSVARWSQMLSVVGVWG